MLTWRFALFLFLLAVIQISVLPFFIPQQMAPNLFLVAVIWLAFHRTFKASLVCAIIGGLVLDFYSGSVIGVQVLALSLIAWFIYALISNFIPKEGSPVLLTTILVTCVVAYKISLFFSFWLAAFFGTGIKPIDFSILNLSLLGQVFLNLLALYPLAQLARKTT